jgi:hypothetical protein
VETVQQIRMEADVERLIETDRHESSGDRFNALQQFGMELEEPGRKLGAIRPGPLGETPPALATCSLRAPRVLGARQRRISTSGHPVALASGTGQ